MDPLTSLVTALAAGAAAALQPTVEQVVKDSYTALKGLIQRKYTRVNVDVLEQDPASESRRAVIQEDLAKTAAATDAELLTQAKTLLDALQRQAPEAIGAVGVDLQAIKAASLTIDDIIATGTGVKVHGAEISGDMTISKVRAGGQGGAPPNR
jgi:phosphatidate phosphatase APP1